MANNIVMQPSGGCFTTSALNQLNQLSQFSNQLSQFGNSGMTWGGSGQLASYVFNPALQPALSGSDYVLFVWVLPASSLSSNGNNLDFNITGILGTNPNAKRIKIIMNPTSAVVGQPISGGTVLADSGVITNPGSGGQIYMTASIVKSGPLGANTQYTYVSNMVVGNTSIGIGASPSPQYTTLNETLPITFAVTGNATAGPSDISIQFIQVWGVN